MSNWNCQRFALIAITRRDRCQNYEVQVCDSWESVRPNLWSNISRITFTGHKWSLLLPPIKASSGRADGPEIYQYSTVRRKWQAALVGHRWICHVLRLLSVSLDIQIFVCILALSRETVPSCAESDGDTSVWSGLVSRFVCRANKWQTLTAPLCRPARLSDMQISFRFSHIL